jgi:hypothetical protein
MIWFPTFFPNRSALASEPEKFFSPRLGLLLGGVKQATKGHKTRLTHPPPPPKLLLKTRLFEFHCKSPGTAAVMAINELSRDKGRQGQIMTHKITHALSRTCETSALHTDQSIR